MKLLTRIRHSVEVELSPEEVNQVLRDGLDCQSFTDSMSLIAQYLGGVSDGFISAIPDDYRQIIHNFLTVQAQRYKQ